MDRKKAPQKAQGAAETDADEPDSPHADSITPGAAEGDLETIEQDLARREQGGPPE